MTIPAVQPPRPTARAARVLVVEDDPRIAAYLGELLPDMGFSLAHHAASAEDAIRAARAESFDLILMDVHLRGPMSGLDAARAILHERRTPIVFLTGDADFESIQAATSMETFGYVLKPFRPSELRAALEIALSRARLEKERDAASAALAKRAKQLALANEELEAFTRTISHDLRGAIRGVQVYASDLEADHGASLSPDARQLVASIREEADRVARIQADLLRFAVSSHADLNLERVDLSALGREILDRLARSDRSRRVETSVEEGLVVQGDPTLLRIALENLLSNAWKYSSHVLAARIELGGGRDPNGELTVFVKDNGAGFDPASVGRLFEPFQRLHAAKEYAGTGLGLASVRRIAERHGGRVWAVGAPGAGATFSFTLAKSAPGGAPA